MSDYKIIKFQNGGITLAFDGKTTTFPVPIHDGLYPIGAELTTLLDTYVANARQAAITINIAVANSSDIDILVEQPTSSQLGTAIRTVRDRFLLLTDWTQLNGAPLTPSQIAEWAVYRDELRALPSQPTFPDTYTWPVPPQPVKTINGRELTQIDGSPVLPLPIIW
jgi:hypothetical protein